VAGYDPVMKLFQVAKHRSEFHVLASTRSSQAAVMVLEPGDATGPLSNEHPRSEQWLFVVSGTGRARVGKRSASLKEGALLLIEKGKVHRIWNSGRSPLVTLNVYAPPAYSDAGELRRA
jgi:mannose-6-phosphate isomerase-like protein (cupin superfamily)